MGKKEGNRLLVRKNRQKSKHDAPEIFFWATGQDDNIGDSLLRRGYLNSLFRIGGVTLWVGGASDSYISGLHTAHQSNVVSSFRRWYLAAFLSAFRQKTVLALNAGELTVSGRGAKRLLVLTPLIWMCRLRGGGGIWLGASVPNHRPAMRFAYAMAAKSCRFVHWRDAESQVTSGQVGVMPDWGFSLGSLTEDWAEPLKRSKVGIVLRGDREVPSEGWLMWIDQMCHRLNLSPHVIVQVGRDEDMALQIAKTLGATVTNWQGVDHATQESIVRAAYRDCAVVVGDRLHGLIVAATEGAVPLAWTPSSTTKAQRHFDIVDLAWVGRYSGNRVESYPVLDHQMLKEYAHDLQTEIERARQTVNMLTEEICHIFGVVPSTGSPASYKSGQV